jgi:hypothetical protein
MTITGGLHATLRRNPAIAELLDRFDEIALPDAWLVAGCLAQTVWNAAGDFEVCAPFGLADLYYLIVRANPRLVSRAVYEAKAARWRSLWPALTVIPWDGGPDPAISAQTSGGTP